MNRVGHSVTDSGPRSGRAQLAQAWPGLCGPCMIEAGYVKPFETNKAVGAAYRKVTWTTSGLKAGRAERIRQAHAKQLTCTAPD